MGLRIPTSPDTCKDVQRPVNIERKCAKVILESFPNRAKIGKGGCTHTKSWPMAKNEVFSLALSLVFVARNFALTQRVSEKLGGRRIGCKSLSAEWFSLGQLVSECPRRNWEKVVPRTWKAGALPLSNARACASLRRGKPRSSSSTLHNCLDWSRPVRIAPVSEKPTGASTFDALLQFPGFLAASCRDAQYFLPVIHLTGPPGFLSSVIGQASVR